MDAHDSSRGSYARTSPRWQSSEIEFLRAEYPSHGKRWCATQLGRSAASIRSKAARLRLELDHTSAFWMEWQQRAAASKVGQKRPEQALVMQALHAQGKLQKTPEQCQAIGEHTRSWIAERGHPRGNLGKHPSQETREKIAMASLRMWHDPDSPAFAALHSEEYRQGLSDRMAQRQAQGILRNGYSRGRQGRRADINNQFFRSAWEANYARYLNWLVSLGEIVRWEYEADIFVFEAIRRGTRSYKPDFKIWEQETSKPYYVEIKGWFDKKSQTKLARMRIYFPNIYIELVDSKRYQALARQVSRLIPGWE